MKKNEFRTLSPFIEEEGIIQVGGRVHNTLVQYKTKYPTLLLQLLLLKQEDITGSPKYKTYSLNANNGLNNYI